MILTLKEVLCYQNDSLGKLHLQITLELHMTLHTNAVIKAVTL